MSEQNTEDNQTSVNKQKAETKESFTKEYVSELRAENAQWRTKAQEAEKLFKDFEEATKVKSKEQEDKITAAIESANQRIIRSELKAFAIEAGMIDLEFLKLVDLSPVKLTEDGGVEGAKELIDGLKEKKPHFFKEFKSSTHHAELPKSKKQEILDVTKLSNEDYQKEKKRALKA